MGKERSWKLENTLKIDDGQLKTPIHDKMCMWVNDNYLEIIGNLIVDLPKVSFIWQRSHRIRHICESSTGYYNDKCAKLSTSSSDLDDCMFHFKDEDDEIFFEDIKGKTKCDMYKNIKVAYNKFKEKQFGREIYKFKLFWEEPLKNNGYVVGIPDFTITVNIENPVIQQNKKLFDDTNMFYRDINQYWDEMKILIEVKPHIKSLGETMRQLKLYRSYLIKETQRKKFDNHIILVTLDSKYKKYFEEQNIGYFVLGGECL